jgi:hypothetical protein
MGVAVCSSGFFRYWVAVLEPFMSLFKCVRMSGNILKDTENNDFSVNLFFIVRHEQISIFLKPQNVIVEKGKVRFHSNFCENPPTRTSAGAWRFHG